MTKSIQKGFSITLGYTICYLSLIVLLPISYLLMKTFSINFASYIKIISATRVIYAFKVSLTCAFLAAIINMIFGFVIAWVLVRYEFIGKKLIDIFVDLPFALPTAIAGISLATLYSKNGILGSFLSIFNIKVAFTPIGIIVAMVFVGLPFMVRTLEPVLRSLDINLEESAYSLGASGWSIFCKIIFPQMIPAILTGFSLSFARAFGEYGSVIFIAGNVPKYTEIVPLLINIKLDQFNYDVASAIAFTMLLISFAILFFVNIIQKIFNSKKN